MTLRVIVQVVPYGDEDKTYEIGRLDIFNKGQLSDRPGLCQYGVLDLSAKPPAMLDDVVYHWRNEGAWELIANVLRNLQIDGP